MESYMIYIQLYIYIYYVCMYMYMYIYICTSMYMYYIYTYVWEDSYSLGVPQIIQVIFARDSMGSRPAPVPARALGELLDFDAIASRASTQGQSAEPLQASVGIFPCWDLGFQHFNLK